MSLKNMFHMHPVDTLWKLMRSIILPIMAFFGVKKGLQIWLPRVLDNIIVHIQDKYQSDLTKKEGANRSWQKMFTDNDDDDDRWT